jgi:hypothetical protein
MTADMYARIRKALPIAKRVLAEGLDSRRCEWSAHIPAQEPQGLTDQQIAQFVKWTEATYEIGIAVGLMLRPDTVLGTFSSSHVPTRKKSGRR